MSTAVLISALLENKQALSATKLNYIFAANCKFLLKILFADAVYHHRNIEHVYVCF